MNYNIQKAYQKAMRFAGESHGDQKIPASESSYLVHLSNVAMELIFAERHSEGFDLEFALQVGLLHDVLEDTPISFEEIEKTFSQEIAEAVLALTKNEELPSENRIPDSLNRIKAFRKEVWAVKLADRITNMQKPPHTWSVEKRKKYREVARLIGSELEGGNAYLEARLQKLIAAYGEFI